MAASQPPPGPDAAMTVSGSVQKYVAKKKKVLSPEEAELYELTQAAGIVMEQEVFRIIVDLLKMNVAPLAVFQMLKSMCAGHRLTDPASAEPSSTAGLTAPSETRGVFIKIPSSPRSHWEPLHPGLGLHVNGVEDTGRNKLNPPATSSQGPPERTSREGSSQRVPRQPSASRMQKSSSSGKSSGGSST